MQVKWIKRPGRFSKFWIFFILFFLILLTPVVVFSFWYNQGLKAVDPLGKEKVFVIRPKESISEIAADLKKENLIRDELAFVIYLKLNCLKLDLTNPAHFFSRNQDCLSNQIQAGSFKLSPSQNAPTLALSLTKGRLDSWLTIVEGLRDEEIASLVSKHFNINEKDFLADAKVGYLFPDTYLFNVNSTAKDIVTKMEDTFSEKLTSDIKLGFEKQGLTEEQGVILASILERESKDTEERPIIAGILEKRLREGWLLEVDATVQYALGYDEATKTWWRNNLTEEELNIDSPFNTRKYLGLPPTPIANPGLSSLKAVANPTASIYYYYLHGKDGKVYYAATLEQHNQNKANHL